MTKDTTDKKSFSRRPTIVFLYFFIFALLHKQNVVIISKNIFIFHIVPIRQ